MEGGGPVLPLLPAHGRLCGRADAAGWAPGRVCGSAGRVCAGLGAGGARHGRPAFCGAENGARRTRLCLARFQNRLPGKPAPDACPGYGAELSAADRDPVCPACAIWSRAGLGPAVCGGYPGAFAGVSGLALFYHAGAVSYAAHPGRLAKQRAAGVWPCVALAAGRPAAGGRLGGDGAGASALVQPFAAVCRRTHADCVVGGFSALACDGKGVFHHAAPAGTAAGRGGHGR